MAADGVVGCLCSVRSRHGDLPSARRRAVGDAAARTALQQGAYGVWAALLARSLPTVVVRVCWQITERPNTVCLVDPSGCVVQLPHTLTIPFARALAQRCVGGLVVGWCVLCCADGRW